MTEEGIKAVRTLSRRDQDKRNPLFQPIQALIAAKAGASYVSPFIGRLDDIAQKGMTIIDDICKIFFNYGLETEVIVASIRNPVPCSSTRPSSALILRRFPSMSSNSS